MQVTFGESGVNVSFRSGSGRIWWTAANNQQLIRKPTVQLSTYLVHCHKDLCWDRYWLFFLGLQLTLIANMFARHGVSLHEYADAITVTDAKICCNASVTLTTGWVRANCDWTQQNTGPAVAWFQSEKVSPVITDLPILSTTVKIGDITLAL